MTTKKSTKKIMKQSLTDKAYELIKNPIAPLVTFIVGLILGGVFCSSAEASGRYHYHDEPVNTTTVKNIYNTKGIALGLATAQHNFDFGTHSWQGSLGVGHYDTNTAVSFGVAKRLNRALVNASFGADTYHTGVGVGVNWRF